MVNLASIESAGSHQSVAPDSADIHVLAPESSAGKGAEAPYNPLHDWGHNLGIGVGLLGLFLSLAAPAQANTFQAKPDTIDKSTLRFQQTHFEQLRLERARQEQQQQVEARLDRLRARLLAPRTNDAPTANAQTTSTQTDSDQAANAPIETIPTNSHPKTPTDSPPQIGSVPASGTYLYGQQPMANQPGTTYFVFETHGVAVTGALYMPSSSFDCVQGQIHQEQIALDVIDSYSQERFSYALALTPPFAQIANQAGAVATPPAIEGFYPLPVQENDRALIATCQAI
ncbi:MAG: hypothetical protein AAFZ17_17640 [Cyanobacteria bacterium J06650_10]